MFYLVVFPFIVGLVGFLQAAINRKIGAYWGLPAATILNSIIFFVIAIIFFLVSSKAPHMLPDSLKPKEPFKYYDWWFVLPGILGFLIVILVPFGIAKVGALNLFVGIIAAQLVASLCWDAFVEGQPATWPRVLGALLSFAGAALGILLK